MPEKPQEDPEIEEALSDLRDATESWAAEDWAEDREMRRAQAKDLFDLRRIRDLIRKDKILEAGIFADQLDTLLREQIPDSCRRLFKKACE